MDSPEGSPQAPAPRERPLNAREIELWNMNVDRRLFGSPKRSLSPNASPRSPRHSKRRKHSRGGKNRSRKNRTWSRKQRK
jgi:hypothetical protein